jgi:metal-responsive CopG/Arc/MetJ family transcriptional regulator
MKLDRQSQFDKNLQVRVPKNFIDELDEAAMRRMVNRADYIRMALQDRLRADAAMSGAVAE